MKIGNGCMAAHCLAVLALGAIPCCAQTTKETTAQETKQETKRTDAEKPAQARPGRDRWPVKTASDLDASEINRKPTNTTVEKLLAMKRPVDLPKEETPEHFQNHRARPAETTVFAVEADVVDCRLMPDGDYRVTIRGASGKSLVLEMPKPEPGFVDPNSPFFKDIKAAREQFDAKAKPETTQKPLKLHARITGIGFWARKWNRNPSATSTANATGSSPSTPNAEENLIQLHPVLKLEWLDKPTREFSTATEKEGAPATKPK